MGPDARGHAGLVAIVGLAAWGALALLSRSPYASLLGHEVLGAPRLAPPAALALFAAGWLLMTVAMMVPGTVPTLARSFGGRAGRLAPGWLAAYLAVWLEFGLVFALADLVVHHVLEPRLPALAGWLPAATLMAAGAYQLTPFKRAFLRRCSARGPAPANAWDALARGWRYGLACVGSGWALMLAVAAVGHATLPAMLAFASLMTLEKVLPRDRRLGAMAGVLLVAWGAWSAAAA